MAFKLIKKIIKEVQKYKSPVKYLRKKGAKIGSHVIIQPPFYGSGDELKFLTIGDNCNFSQYVSFILHDGSNTVSEHLQLSNPHVRKTLPISIGNNCFIGYRTIFLPGSSVGNNCIVGAGSLVTKQFPDNVVIAGVPAKIIETLDNYLLKNQSVLQIDGEKLNVFLKTKNEK